MLSSRHFSLSVLLLTFLSSGLHFASGNAACQAFLNANDASVTTNNKIVVNGGGASFPNRIYQDAMFAYGFYTSGSDVSVTYAAFGSGSGKCRMKGYCEYCSHPFDDVDVGTDNSPQVNLDFGGSDSLLKIAEYDAVPDLQMYPSVAGAVVPIYNLKEWGITDLVLSPIAISQIFRQCKDNHVDCEPGSIINWNDPKIVALNPQHEQALNLAGRIELIVREDKSGTTEIFKKALAAFEPAFDTQVGISSSPNWENVEFTMAGSNSGVAGAVLSKLGTFGYSVLAEATTTRISTVRILKPGALIPIEATAQTVRFAVFELGLNFGNNGDDPSRLTADIHNAVGPKAWPIAGYSYFVIRKNHSRQGSTCANRFATFNFLEWFYTNAAVSELAETHGFSTLPKEVSIVVLEHMQREMLCTETGLVVYKPPPVVMVLVNPILSPLINILRSVYSLLDDEAELFISSSESIADRSAGASTSPRVIKLGLATNAPLSGGDAGVVSLPLIGAAFVPIASLCGPTSSCAFKDIELSMTVDTLAAILDQSITSWDDDRISAKDSEGSSVALPPLRITIIRTSDVEELALEALFVSQMASKVEGFSYSATGSDVITESFGESVKSAVYALPGSIAVILATTEVGSLATKINLNLNDAANDVTTVPSVESIASGEWPFTVDFILSFPTNFEGSACEVSDVPDDPISLAKTRTFAVFMNWFLDWNSIERPITTNGMAFLPLVNGTRADLNELRFSVLCNSQSIMRPDHDITVTGDVFRVFIVVLSLLASVFIVGLMIWTFIHRKTRLIRTSTYSFMLQILCGSLVSLATISALLADDRDIYEANVGDKVNASDIQADLDFACQTIPVLFFIGYGIVFTPLLLKTWRVVVLFDLKSIKKMKISTSLLMKYELLVMSPVIGVLAAWQVFDPLRWVRTIKITDSLSGFPTKSIGRCECDQPMLYLGPLFCFVLLTLIYGNVLSFRGLNIPVEFSEGKWISIALINFFECFLFCIPLMFVTVETPDLDVMVKSMFILIVNVGTVIIIYFPKLHLLYTATQAEKDKLGREVSSYSSKASSKFSSKASSNKAHSDKMFSSASSVAPFSPRGGEELIPKKSNGTANSNTARSSGIIL